MEMIDDWKVTTNQCYTFHMVLHKLQMLLSIFFISTFYIVLGFSNKMKSMSQKKYSMEFTSATDHNPLPSTQLTNWNKILKLLCGLLDSTAISILQQWHQQHRVRNLRIFQF